MKPFRINNKDKSKSLAKIALANNLDIQDVLSIYLILGDDLFFVLSALSGKTVKFPTHNKLSEVGNNQSIKIFECEEGDYVVGEIIESDVGLYKVIREPQSILNHYYCVIEKVIDND